MINRTWNNKQYLEHSAVGWEGTVLIMKKGQGPRIINNPLHNQQVLV